MPSNILLLPEKISLFDLFSMALLDNLGSLTAICAPKIVVTICHKEISSENTNKKNRLKEIKLIIKELIIMLRLAILIKILKNNITEIKRETLVIITARGGAAIKKILYKPHFIPLIREDFKLWEIVR